MKYGFVRVAAAVPQVKVADCRYNASQAEEMILRLTRIMCRLLFSQS